MTDVEGNLGLSSRFRILRRLGEGGMGAVYLAEQIAVGNRPVALKILLRRLLDGPDFLQRFRDEAASTGRIRHPNVVTIYESGQNDDGAPYIAMEYLEGESLRHALKTRGPLPVAECAEILQQAARGLHAAHKLGIIHRDLKPDNIFLTYLDEAGQPTSHGLPARARAWPGQPWHDEPSRPEVAEESPPANLVVKIVDFGIAKLRESATHTLTGTVLGTPAYMSYEQASGMKSDELDARSDVYSLGVVAYEMLTGRLPFESDTPVGYLRKHLHETPPPFRTVNPDLPALSEVESVVMKALTKDRDQRYGSVLEFAQEFMRAAAIEYQSAAQAESEQRTVKARPEATVAPSPTTRGSQETRHIAATKGAPEKASPSRELLAVAAGGFVIFLVAFLAIFLMVKGPALQERTLTGHTGAVTSVAFSPDGKLLASGSQDGTIRFWEVASGSQTRTLRNAPDAIESVAFSPDGRLLASLSFSGSVKLWTVTSGGGDQAIQEFKGTVSPNPYEAILNAKGFLLLPCQGVAFSPAGELLAAGKFETVKLWDVSSLSLVRLLAARNVCSLQFSPDGKFLAGTDSDVVKLWDVGSGAVIKTLANPLLGGLRGASPEESTGALTSLAFSPKGDLVGSGGTSNETVGIWDVASGNLRQTLTAGARDVRSVAFGGDGKLLATASGDDIIKLWDVATGTMKRTLTGHTGAVNCLAFSPDGKMLASGSDDKTIKLWHIEH